MQSEELDSNKTRNPIPAAVLSEWMFSHLGSTREEAAQATRQIAGAEGRSRGLRAASDKRDGRGRLHNHRPRSTTTAGPKAQPTTRLQEKLITKSGRYRWKPC